MLGIFPETFLAVLLYAKDISHFLYLRNHTERIRFQINIIRSEKQAAHGVDDIIPFPLFQCGGFFFLLLLRNVTPKNINHDTVRLTDKENLCLHPDKFRPLHPVLAFHFLEIFHAFRLFPQAFQGKCRTEPLRIFLINGMFQRVLYNLPIVPGMHPSCLIFHFQINALACPRFQIHRTHGIVARFDNGRHPHQVPIPVDFLPRFLIHVLECQNHQTLMAAAVVEMGSDGHVMVALVKHPLAEHFLFLFAFFPRFPQGF